MVDTLREFSTSHSAFTIRLEGTKLDGSILFALISDSSQVDSLRAAAVTKFTPASAEKAHGLTLTSSNGETVQTVLGNISATLSLTGLQRPQSLLSSFHRL